MKLISIAFLILFSSCKAQQKPTVITQPSEAFKKQWYSGLAEINSYTLQQARYGEMRDGEAVLIFVTEDFSNKNLVKLDDPQSTADKTSVLKVNFTKKFNTGIYPYSMMLSAFTPVTAEGNKTPMKIDCSSQEWCGHSFTQLRQAGNGFDWQMHSYFETESEEKFSLPASFTEDGIWAAIRISPDALPQGNLKLIPGLFWLRLSHLKIQPEAAVLKLSNAQDSFINENNVKVYSIEYPAISRTLRIYFKSVFPYQIMGWQETYPDGFGSNKKLSTTSAILKKSLMLDYWKHNKNVDSSYSTLLELK